MAHREKYGRIVLLYGTRTPEDILYRRELERWRRKFDLEVHVTVDRATAGGAGNVGVVPTLLGRAPFDAATAVALVCGPEVMMRFTVMELQRRGVATDRIYLSMERNMKCAVGPLRPLPVRAGIRLQGRAGVSFRPHRAAAEPGGDLTWRDQKNRSWQYGNSPPATAAS